MEAWWQSLSGIEHFFYLIAIPSTVILLIQTILTFVGGLELGVDMDVDFETDGDFSFEEAATADLKLWSVRGIVAFLTLFGWVGVSLSASKVNVIITFVVALLAGALAMYLVAWIFMQMYKLQESGNVDFANAAGKTGQVYLKIPKARSGIGKIQVVVQERLVEIDAITDDEEDIPTGAKVYVITKLEDNKVVVESK